MCNGDTRSFLDQPFAILCRLCRLLSTTLQNHRKFDPNPSKENWSCKFELKTFFYLRVSCVYKYFKRAYQCDEYGHDKLVWELFVHVILTEWVTRENEFCIHILIVPSINTPSCKVDDQYIMIFHMILLVWAWLLIQNFVWFINFTWILHLFVSIERIV